MDEIFTHLTSLFYDRLEDLGEVEAVEADAMPEAYQSLLAHHDHMTVTNEAWHNSLVDVHVLTEQKGEDYYARKIVLVTQRDARPVQFGIVRIKLDVLPEIVRLEIESQALPLGRIMIRHHLMREVELCQLWRVKPGPELRLHMELEDEGPVYARTARILVDGEPAVEMLEIVHV